MPGSPDAPSTVRQRSNGATRDLDAARQAYSSGNVELSRLAHSVSRASSEASDGSSPMPKCEPGHDVYVTVCMCTHGMFACNTHNTPVGSTLWLLHCASVVRLCVHVCRSSTDSDESLCAVFGAYEGVVVATALIATCHVAGLDVSQSS